MVMAEETTEVINLTNTDDEASMEVWLPGENA